MNKLFQQTESQPRTRASLLDINVVAAAVFLRLTVWCTVPGGNANLNAAPESGGRANKDNPRTVGFCGGAIGATDLVQSISSSTKNCCPKKVNKVVLRTGPQTRTRGSEVWRAREGHHFLALLNADTHVLVDSKRHQSTGTPSSASGAG